MCMSRDDFLTAIYTKYAHRLENFCLQYVHYQSEYRELIDDCIQRTFESAIHEYEKLSRCSYVEAWLFKACTNRLTTALRTYRRRKKRQTSLDDEVSFVLPQEAIIASIDEFVYRLSNQELIERILVALNDREREVVQRHLIQGESLEDLAKEKETTLGAMKAVLARIRSKARKIGGKNLKIFFIIFVSFQQIMRLRK